MMATLALWGVVVAAGLVLAGVLAGAVVLAVTRLDSPLA